MSDDDVTQNPDGSVTLNRTGVWEMSSPPSPPQPVVGMDFGVEDGMVVMIGDRIQDVLAHTEIVETDGADLIASPDQVWLIPKGEQQTLTWEFTLTEEQFWKLVGAVWGPEVVREMKEEINDWLRWEGEGGPCLH